MRESGGIVINRPTPRCGTRQSILIVISAPASTDQRAVLHTQVGVLDIRGNALLVRSVQSAGACNWKFLHEKLDGRELEVLGIGIHF